MRMLSRMPVLVAATFVLMAPVLGQEESGKTSRRKEIGESAKKVKELQKERIATLEEMIAVNTKLFQNGRIEFDPVIDAHLLLLDARLDATEKTSDRVTLYKNMVDMLIQYEEFAAHRKLRAEGTEATVLKIKAKRLEAQIHLEQEKAKEAQESK